MSSSDIRVRYMLVPMWSSYESSAVSSSLVTISRSYLSIAVLFSSLFLEPFVRRWLDDNPVVCDCSFYLNAFTVQKQNTLRTKDLRDWHCLDNGTFPSKEFLMECRVPPQIGIEPRDSEVFVGGKIRLNCEAIGVPHPNVTWSFNGEPLQLDDRKQISRGSLRIKNTTIEDEGEYQCNATNTEGTVSSKQATLIIKEDANEESADA